MHLLGPNENLPTFEWGGEIIFHKILRRITSLVHFFLDKSFDAGARNAGARNNQEFTGLGKNQTNAKKCIAVSSVRIYVKCVNLL